MEPLTEAPTVRGRTVVHRLRDDGLTHCNLDAQAVADSQMFEPLPCRGCIRRGDDESSPRIQARTGLSVHGLKADGRTFCGLTPAQGWLDPQLDPRAASQLPECQRCSYGVAIVTEEMHQKNWCIYALRSIIGGREIVKFGETWNLDGRLAAIRADMPAPVELIGAWHTMQGDAAIHLVLLDRMGEVQEVMRLASGSVGRFEWYYRDDDTDRIVNLLMTDDVAAQRAIAKASAWMELGRHKDGR